MQRGEYFWTQGEPRPVEDVALQAPGIGVSDVVDPSLYRGIEIGDADAAVMVFVYPVTQATSRHPDFACFHASMRHGIPCVTGATCAVGSWMTRRRRAMRSMIARFHSQQGSLAVREQHEVVHIAEIRLTAQLPRHELVERMQVAVRPELGREISDRYPPGR